MANTPNTVVWRSWPNQWPADLDEHEALPTGLRRVVKIANGGRRRFALAALFCLVLVATTAVWWTADHCCPWVAPVRPELRALVAATGTRRPLEGRLTGGFAYAPMPDGVAIHLRSGSPANESRPRTAQPLWPADMRIAIAEIERRYLASDEPANEASWGTATLVAGDIDAGIEIFDSVLTRAGDRAEVWSDASAAYLAGAQHLERDELWVQALEAAERARQLRPDLPEALFNRALALEGIGLVEQASRAWRDYLASEPASAWADEGRRHERTLTAAMTASADWDSLRHALDARLSQGPWLPDDAARAIRFRQQLRIWIERTLIPDWATAVLAHDAAGATAALARAKAAADLLRRAGGDPMPVLAISRIEAFGDRESNRAAKARLRALAAAHLELPAIAELWDAGAATQAALAFERAQPAFLAARSPYAEWNAMYAAMAAYIDRDLDRVHVLLDASQSRAPETSYLTSVRGWLRGLIALNENRLDDARTAYEAALRIARDLGEADTIAGLSALLAENYAALGDSRQAWRYQRVGLEQVPRIAAARRKHLILQLGGLLCFSDDAPRAALEFQDAVIGVARAADRVTSLTEGYLHRARTAALINRLSAARADLDRASALLPRIEVEALRRRETAEVDAATAEVLSTAAPHASVDAASRALAYFRETGTEFRMSGLYLLRGRAYRAQGRLDQAEKDFAAAIDRFEALRDRVVDRKSRVLIFKDGWNAFSEMVDLAVSYRHTPEAALEFAEQARARTLLEAMAGPAARPEAARATVDHLAADTVVLFYVTQPDRLLLWVVTSKGIRFIERPIAEHQLRFSVARIQRLLSTQTGAVSGATDRLLRDTLRSLHAELIAPARQAIGTATTLVIVPDGPLHALPFAALVDPSTDRHLVENYVIGIAPSLTTFRRANAGEKPTGPAQALLVGDPLLQAGPKGFASLPAARDEVRVLAGLYPGARTLIAADATRQAFFTHLAEADVVHYAGHAIVDDHEPDRSRLLLADDATATNGVLFVHELQTSTLPRRPLVVLAACSTNRGRIAAGEGVQSLARPFLGAGARSVIATLWDVDDRLSTALFRRFHQHVAAGVSSARALAEAQRELIAHPDGEMRAGANWAWGVAIGGSVQ